MVQHLDVIGRLPTPDETRAFLADTDPARREKLIDRLLDCPVKDFFVPLPSESTRSLRPWTSQARRSTATT